MFRLLPVLGLAVFLASCAGTTPEPPPKRTFQPSYTRPDVSPTAAAVERTTTDVRREADALRGQVGLLRRSAAEASVAAETAQSSLDSLIEAKGATEADLVDLQVLFSAMTRRNMFLEEEAQRLEESHDTLSEKLDLMEKTVSELRVAAAQADEGKAELTALLSAANDHNDELAEANARLAKAAQASEKSAASSKTWRNMVFIGIGVAVLLAVVWLGLRAYKPPWNLL